MNTTCASASDPHAMSALNGHCGGEAEPALVQVEPVDSKVGEPLKGWMNNDVPGSEMETLTDALNAMEKENGEHAVLADAHGTKLKHKRTELDEFLCRLS